MPNKIKILDYMIASEIFLIAILEYISYLFLINENYDGVTIGSRYDIEIYPLLNTIGFFIVALCKVFKTKRFNLCIYTILVSWIFFTIQLINLSVIIFKYGFEIYNDAIYPIFLFSIFGLIILKSVRACSQKH